MTTGTSKATSLRPTLGKLGPALVAGVAYLDPGNFASNLASGAMFNYSLVWVVLIANATAWFVQYLAAKLAIGSGESLTGLLSGRFKSKFARLAYWLQAEVVILATEIAEVVGGAVAFNILFGLPLGVGAVLTAVISMVILASQGRTRGFFTALIIALTVVTSAGIIAAVNFGLIDPVALGAGLVPRIQSQAELLVTLGMLGATVMPHAIYSHSAFVRDKFGYPHWSWIPPEAMREHIDSPRFHAGIKDNIIPAEAEARINFRILPGDTVESVLAAVKLWWLYSTSARRNTSPYFTPGE